MSPLVLCTLVLIFTLFFSGIAKAKEPSSIAAAIVNLKLDHLIPLKLAARAVPWGEPVSYTHLTLPTSDLV